MAVHFAKHLGYGETDKNGTNDSSESSVNWAGISLEKFYLQNLSWFWLAACTVSYAMYFSIGGFLHVSLIFFQLTDYIETIYVKIPVLRTCYCHSLPTEWRVFTIFTSESKIRLQMGLWDDSLPKWSEITGNRLRNTMNDSFHSILASLASLYSVAKLTDYSMLLNGCIIVSYALQWYFYVRQRDKAEEWKCQPQKWITPELERHEIIVGTFSLLVTSTFTSCLACYFYNGGPSTIYFKFDEYTWTWWFLSWPVIYIYLVGIKKKIIIGQSLRIIRIDHKRWKWAQEIIGRNLNELDAQSDKKMICHANSPAYKESVDSDIHFFFSSCRVSNCSICHFR